MQKCISRVCSHISLPPSVPSLSSGHGHCCHNYLTLLIYECSVCVWYNDILFNLPQWTAVDFWITILSIRLKKERVLYYRMLANEDGISRWAYGLRTLILSSNLFATKKPKVCKLGGRSARPSFPRLFPWALVTTKQSWHICRMWLQVMNETYSIP